jgi:hypothetical protein
VNGSFDAETSQLLDEIEEVHIETRRDESAPAHRTIIWVVTVGWGHLRALCARREGPHVPRGLGESECGAGRWQPPHPGARRAGDRRSDGRGCQRCLPEKVRTEAAGPHLGHAAARHPAQHPEVGARLIKGIFSSSGRG